MRELCGSLLTDDIDIRSESKADDKYPVVSAASIVAKVSRDLQLNTWVFKEAMAVGQEFDHEFGCGYPSDPKSKIWLQKHCDDVFGFPSLVRFSWKTCKDMIAKNKEAVIEWRDPKIGEEKSEKGEN